MLLTAEGVAKISDVRVATGLRAEERISDASPRGFSYAPTRHHDRKGAAATVSAMPASPLHTCKGADSGFFSEYMHKHGPAPR